MSIFVSMKRDDQLIIRFDYTEDRVKKIRSIVGRSWNQKESHWTIPFQHESVKNFYDLFAQEEIITHNEVKNLIYDFIPELSYREHNKNLLIKAIEELKLKGYSEETQKSYLGHIRRFLIYSNKESNLLSKEDIRKYLMCLLDEKEKSHSYVNQVISAIRFLFIKILRK